MADDPTPQEQPDGETPKAEQTPSLSDLPEGVKTALDTERKRAKSAERKAAELERRIAEFENQGKSDVERLSGERDALEKENTSLADENRRLKVAIDKQLPPDLVGRLQGESVEEMAEDADRLLALFKPSNPGRGAFDEGARSEVDEEAELSPEQQHQRLLANLLGPGT